MSPTKTKILKRSTTQTGKHYSLNQDKKRKAFPPGLRLSKNKKKYSERRKNRTDLHKGKYYI